MRIVPPRLRLVAWFKIDYAQLDLDCSGSGVRFPCWKFDVEDKE
jgi:hypothetical protein